MKTQLDRYREALKFLHGLPLFATLDEKGPFFSTSPICRSVPMPFNKGLYPLC